ncbi:unnamed protein product, partial [Closterium sp. Yama58-4]
MPADENRPWNKLPPSSASEVHPNGYMDNHGDRGDTDVVYWDDWTSPDDMRAMWADPSVKLLWEARRDASWKVPFITEAIGDKREPCVGLEELQAAVLILMRRHFSGRCKRLWPTGFAGNEGDAVLAVCAVARAASGWRVNVGRCEERVGAGLMAVSQWGRQGWRAARVCALARVASGWRVNLGRCEKGVGAGLMMVSRMAGGQRGRCRAGGLSLSKGGEWVAGEGLAGSEGGAVLAVGALARAASGWWVNFDCCQKGVGTGLMIVLQSSAEWLAKDMGYRAYATDVTSSMTRRPFPGLYYGMAYLAWLTTYKGVARSEEFVVRAYHGGPGGWEKGPAASHWNKYREAKEVVLRMLHGSSAPSLPSMPAPSLSPPVLPPTPLRPALDPLHLQSSHALVAHPPHAHATAVLPAPISHPNSCSLSDHGPIHTDQFQQSPFTAPITAGPQATIAAAQPASFSPAPQGPFTSDAEISDDLRTPGDGEVWRSSGDTKHRRAYPVIQPDTKHTKLKVSQEGLSVIRSIKNPIAIVAVIGPYRSGKSFLLNQLLTLTCDEGFGVGHARDTKTKGIWVWGDPMEMQVNGQTTSVLFLDTEGFESVGKSSVYDDRIFALATVLSSVLIYNLAETVLSEADASFAESDASFAESDASFAESDASFAESDASYAESGAGHVILIPCCSQRPPLPSHTSCFCVDASCGQDGAGDGAGGSAIGAEPAAFLSPPLTHTPCPFLPPPEGKTVQEMVRGALQPVPNPEGDKDVDQVNLIRQSLNLMAANSTAFGLTQPHLARTRLCELSDDELDPKYVRQRNQLRQLVASLVQPKIVSGKPVTGEEFADLLEKTLNALNKGHIPTAGSVVDAFNRAVQDKCLAIYHQAIRHVLLPAEEAALMAAYRNASGEAVAAFERERFGGKSVEDAVRPLKDELREELVKLKRENEFASAKACEGAHRGCEEELDALANMRLPSVAKFDARLEACNHTVENACRGPSKSAYRDRLKKTWTRERSQFLKEYNQRLFNWLVIGSLVLVVVGRFMVKWVVVEVLAWALFVFLETYTRIFWSFDSLYLNPAWRTFVNIWEAVVYNPFIDLDL